MLAAVGARLGPWCDDFPGETCISLNDEAVHGIPGTAPSQAGDLVTLDVTAELDGYMADAAVTVPVPPAPDDEALASCAADGAAAGVRRRPGRQPVSEIGRGGRARGRARAASACCAT